MASETVLSEVAEGKLEWVKMAGDLMANGSDLERPKLSMRLTVNVEDC